MTQEELERFKNTSYYDIVYKNHRTQTNAIVKNGDMTLLLQYVIDNIDKIKKINIMYNAKD